MDYFETVTTTNRRGIKCIIRWKLELEKTSSTVTIKTTLVSAKLQVYSETEKEVGSLNETSNVWENSGRFPETIFPAHAILDNKNEKITELIWR